MYRVFYTNSTKVSLHREIPRSSIWAISNQIALISVLSIYFHDNFKQNHITAVFKQFQNKIKILEIEIPSPSHNFFILDIKDNLAAMSFRH